jgi:hypothetical protein
MSSTNIVLGVLLIGSLALNVYCWTDEKSTTEECNHTHPFTDAAVIDESDARRYEEAYRTTLQDEDKTLGGIFSRAAFEKLLCTESCNAVAYTFGRDESGENGPEGRGVFIMIKGVHVDYDEERNEIRSIRNLGTETYIGGYWCPPSCTP